MGFWPVVEHIIRNADIVIQVIDARMPELSRNTEIERKLNSLDKMNVTVFNKIDLISESDLKKLKKENARALFVSGIKNIGVSDLKRSLMIIGKRMRIEWPIIGVVGYPNVGKSAIINALAHRARASISPIAGTTKGPQWIKAGSLRIIDSPGVIPMEDKNTNLGLIAAKNPEKIGAPEKVALEIIRIFLEKDPNILQKYYNLDSKCLKKDRYEIMLEIGKKRGYLSKGGIVNEVKTAIQIVREWQTGRLSFKTDNP